MSYQSNRFEICLATEKDDPELISILEEVELPGPIKLVYTRRPSPTQSFKREGHKVGILICRDFKKKCIVSLGAFAIRTMYINGEKNQVAYLFGLRSLKRYRLRFPLRNGYEFLKNQLPQPIDFIYTSILDNNFGAISLFTKKHLLMPKYHKIFTYATLCLNQQKIIKRSSKKNIICRATLKDVDQVFQFLQARGPTLNGFPVIEKNELQEINSDKFITNFFIYFDQNKTIKGIMSVINTSSYKQYIVTGYHWKIKAYNMMRYFLPFIKLPVFPKIGQCINTSFLAYWAMEQENEDLLIDFLANICSQKDKIPFLLFGLPKESPYFKVINELSYINYQSSIYQVSWEDGNEQKTLKAPFYLECSTL